MRPPIGFILLTHSNSPLNGRIIKKLDSVFDSPPIVCHHDFSKSEFSCEKLKSNFSFTNSYAKTKWADFSLVEATILGLEQLYAKHDPDWFVLLSGSDYPIQPANQVLHDLNCGSFDAHINGELISVCGDERNWETTCYNRYLKKRIVINLKTKKNLAKKYCYIFQNKYLNRYLLPFSKTFFCYSGYQFFSANRKSAAHILDFHKSNKKLAKHYVNCPHPEESYFQTILANSQDIKVNNNPWRYIDWSHGGSHPKILTSSDLSIILESRAHFARKFDPQVDSKILDMIDMKC